MPPGMPDWFMDVVEAFVHRAEIAITGEKGARIVDIKEHTIQLESRTDQPEAGQDAFSKEVKEVRSLVATMSLTGGAARNDAKFQPSCMEVRGVCDYSNANRSGFGREAQAARNALVSALDSTCDEDKIGPRNWAGCPSSM